MSHRTLRLPSHAMPCPNTVYWNLSAASPHTLASSAWPCAFMPAIACSLWSVHAPRRLPTDVMVMSTSLPFFVPFIDIRVSNVVGVAVVSPRINIDIGSWPVHSIANVVLLPVVFISVTLQLSCFGTDASPTLRPFLMQTWLVCAGIDMPDISAFVAISHKSSGPLPAMNSLGPCCIICATAVGEAIAITHATSRQFCSARIGNSGAIGRGYGIARAQAYAPRGCATRGARPLRPRTRAGSPRRQRARPASS